MADPADRLKAAVRERMAQLGMHDWTQLGARSGVKARTLTNILSGQSSRRRPAVEIALGWAIGSIDAVLAGGEATITGNPVGGGQQDVGVLKGRDQSVLNEIVRELRQISSQQAALAERQQRTIGALADELADE